MDSAFWNLQKWGACCGGTSHGASVFPRRSTIRFLRLARQHGGECLSTSAFRGPPSPSSIFGTFSKKLFREANWAVSVGRCPREKRCNICVSTAGISTCIRARCRRVVIAGNSQSGSNSARGQARLGARSFGKMPSTSHGSASKQARLRHGCIDNLRMPIVIGDREADVPGSGQRAARSRSLVAPVDYPAVPAKK